MAAPLKRLFQIYPDAPHAIQPLGIRLNDTIYAGGISGRDAATGELAPDLESQTALVLHHLKALLERGDAGLDNLARCVAYVTTPEHREPVDAAWLRLWPDERDKPAFKILTGAALPPGELIRLDALALAGGRRTRIDLPNVPAHDPTVRIGNWVFTSRLHGSSPGDGKLVTGGLEAEAAQVMRNLIQLVELAGGSRQDVVQVNTFGNDASYIPAARRAFEEAFPHAATRPAFHPLISWVRSTNALMAEGAAVLDTSDGPTNGERFEELFFVPERNNQAAGVKLGSFVFAPAIASDGAKAC